jgi:hypothetical protein
LRRFQASFRWFFFFLLFHASMMSDLIVDAHDVVESEIHPTSFYIKDQKAVSSNKFGIAPFDASKSLTKLTSWDSPPTKAEVEEIKPLLTRIQSLKSASGGGLTGMQLMVFFLQRRI